ncbi:MAG TPA: hypothetical protein VN408_32100, partial [Actinoplanes sp.]|nr:hypothetical protein [Actinoplanes sp.]
HKPAAMPLTVPVLRVLEACRGQRVSGPLIRRPVSGKPIAQRQPTAAPALTSPKTLRTTRSDSRAGAFYPRVVGSSPTVSTTREY